MAAAFIAAGTGIAALAAGGGYIQMESGKKENQVRISLDFSGDREIGKYMEDIGAVQVDLALETPEPDDIPRAEFTFEASEDPGWDFFRGYRPVQHFPGWKRNGRRPV